MSDVICRAQPSEKVHHVASQALDRAGPETTTRGVQGQGGNKPACNVIVIIVRVILLLLELLHITPRETAWDMSPAARADFGSGRGWVGAAHHAA